MMMKMHKLLAVFTAIVLLMPFTCVAQAETTGFRVIIDDAAELLSITEETAIREKIQGITRYCNAGVYTYSGPDLSEAYTLGEEWAEQRFGKEDYVVFMIHLSGRQITLVSSAPAFAVIPFDRCSAILDQCITYVIGGDYALCAQKAMEQYEQLLAEYDPLIREYRAFIRDPQQVSMPGFTFPIPAGFQIERDGNNVLYFSSPDGFVCGGIEVYDTANGGTSEEEFLESMEKLDAQETIAHVHKITHYDFWGPSENGLKVYAMPMWYNGHSCVIYAAGQAGTKGELVKTVKMIGYGAYIPE